MDVRKVGVERGVEALTDMAVAAILLHTQYAMLAPGVEEVRRTAIRAEGSLLSEREQGLYAKFRSAGGVARNLVVGDPQMVTPIRSRIDDGLADERFNRLWAGEGLAKFGHNGW